MLRLISPSTLLVFFFCLANPAPVSAQIARDQGSQSNQDAVRPKEGVAVPTLNGLIQEIKTDHGYYTPKIGDAFLRFCESEVAKQLAGMGVHFTEEQVAVLRNDRDLYMASYGTVYPPDPRIGLNILELRQQLGSDLFQKYKQLVIAGAVTRRHAGLDTGDMREKEEYCIKGPQDPAKYRWHTYSVVHIPFKYVSAPQKIKKRTPTASLSKRKKKKRAAAEKLRDLRFVSDAGVKKYMAFLKANNLTPSDTYRSPALSKRAMEAMGDDAPKEGRFSVSFYKSIMVSQALRPAKRDPFPSMVDYIRYLDTLPTHRFPIESTPWPILFPLAKGWPLREARDIVKRHEGRKKLNTYGKYHGKREVYIARFKPSPWHEDSWQGKVQAGGVCHEMSTIGVGTHQALGIPSCKAGKPHHSFLIVFKKSKGKYICKAMQGSAKGGWSQWGFADPKTEHSITYHQGLAAAMNVGLESYMHTRIAVHLAHLLIEQSEPALAKTILTSANQLNPHNVQVQDALKQIKP